MSLAEQFFEEFCKVYRNHRWPSPRGEFYTSKQWTEEMSKILDKTAKRLGLRRKRKELRRIDFNWYKEGSNTPALSVEHENGYKGIWEEEIPKLLLSKADLKVLICYPPKKEHWRIGNRLLKLLQEENEQGRFKEEFLLIMGLPTQEIRKPEQFTCYRYSLQVNVKRLRLK